MKPLSLQGKERKHVCGTAMNDDAKDDLDRVRVCRSHRLPHQDDCVRVHVHALYRILLHRIDHNDDHGGRYSGDAYHSSHVDVQRMNHNNDDSSNDEAHVQIPVVVAVCSDDFQEAKEDKRQKDDQQN